jgi:hypothetical protein
MADQQIEITVFRKANGGLLSKRIFLQDGKIIADGSACSMARGTASRVKLNGVASLAELIGTLGSDEALTLGRLRPGLPDQCRVIVKDKLNGALPPDVIARTVNFLQFAAAQAAYMLIDYDTKGMPKEVAARLQGGFWTAITAVCPSLAAAARVTRCSSSAGLSRADTGQCFAGSSNEHVYIAVADGSDIERAVKTLHQRCWLAGFGFYLISDCGSLLSRSIVDQHVGRAERLVFEGGAEVVPPLQQDATVRRPQAHDGVVLDTRQAIPDLSAEELSRFKVLLADAARPLRAKAAEVRTAWAVKYAKRRGLSVKQAEKIIAAAAGGEHILALEFELEFDDDNLGTCTVADVLADPERFVGERLADPLEGRTHRGKAMVLKRRDGTLMIHSYAHGEINYRLAGQGVTRDDFYAYLPSHKYFYAPTRELWPVESVNACIPPVPLLDDDGNPLHDDNDKPIRIAASVWLDRHRAVQQMTWAPGYETPMIEDYLVDHGGWVKRIGTHTFNHYAEPRQLPGDPEQAGPWSEHLHKLYPDDADHIEKYLAHRVQRPDEKLNHALVLGGAQRIGKDSLLEPAKRAIGHANFQEVTPLMVMDDKYNGFARSVVLRINEGRDLGEFNRYKFYEHLKGYIAAPPDVLSVNEKYLPRHYVLNVCAVIITTNHKTDGIYLPEDDQRHYVAWSDCETDDFSAEYWIELWGWYESGGFGHVAAYLRQLDLRDFNAKAPPPKAAAWWAIVDANKAPEDAEFADALDALATVDELLGKRTRPKAVTLDMIRAEAGQDFRPWLDDEEPPQHPTSS